MNFHAIGPHFPAKVLSLCKPFFSPRWPIQSDPTPHAGVDSIGADDPFCLEDRIAKDDAVGAQTSDWRVPEESDSALLRPVDHSLVEDCSTHSESAGTRKASFHRSCSIYKSDCAKNPAIVWPNPHAKLAQRRHCARHESFTASFVNGRFCSVCNRNSKTLHSRGDGRRQSCRAPANDQHTSAFPHVISLDLSALHN